MSTPIHTLKNEIEKLKMELFYAKRVGSKEDKEDLKKSIREHKKAVKILKKKR